MDDEDTHSSAWYWRSVLSYAVREATAIEAHDNSSMTDDKEGRVGWT